MHCTKKKRRRIHENVEKTILEISTSDSTYVATPGDASVHTKPIEHENLIGACYTFDPLSAQYSVSPDQSQTGSCLFSYNRNLEIPEEGHYVEETLSSTSDSSKSDSASDDVNDESLGSELLAWAKECNISSVHVGSPFSCSKEIPSYTT